VRQFLLRHVPCTAKFAQIESEYLPDVHAREGNALKSILPRSILDNRPGVDQQPCWTNSYLSFVQRVYTVGSATKKMA
jgi:hypothetical protein